MKVVKLIKIILDFFYKEAIRLRLKNYNFSIISDDCWGGRMYLDLGIPYTSPTVNLFIYSSCYLKLVQDLKGYMNKEFVFVESSKYEKANKMRTTSNKFYPIGVLGDIEIHFLHSKDNTDALTKWESRKKRLNYNRLVYKFSDAYLNDPQDLVEFDHLPIKNKVIFVAKEYKGLQNYILLNDFKKEGYVSDPFKYKWIYRRNFDVVKWLNNFKD